MLVSKVKELYSKKKFLAASINYHFIGMFRGWENDCPTELLSKEELGINEYYYSLIQAQFAAEKAAYLEAVKELKALDEPKTEKETVIVTTTETKVVKDIEPEPFNHPRIVAPEKKPQQKKTTSKLKKQRRYIVDVGGKKITVNSNQYERLQYIKSIKDLNDASRLEAFNHKLRWTTEDEDLLKKMYSHGIAIEDIAHALGRTILAIIARVSMIHKRGELKNRGKNHQ